MNEERPRSYSQLEVHVQALAQFEGCSEEIARAAIMESLGKSEPMRRMGIMVPARWWWQPRRWWIKRWMNQVSRET